MEKENEIQSANEVKVFYVSKFIVPKSAQTQDGR